MTRVCFWLLRSDLAKAYILLFVWAESIHPLAPPADVTADGTCPMCSGAGCPRGVGGNARCWAFMAEMLTTLYLTAETSLYLIGCEPPRRYFSDAYSRQPDRPGPITKQVRKRFADLERDAPSSVEEAMKLAWRQ